MTTQNLRERFLTEPPRPGALALVTDMRSAFAELALAIDDVAPDSREKDTALTKLEEAKFWTNQAIVFADNAIARAERAEKEN